MICFCFCVLLSNVSIVFSASRFFLLLYINPLVASTSGGKAFQLSCRRLQPERRKSMEKFLGGRW